MKTFCLVAFALVGSACGPSGANSESTNTRAASAQSSGASASESSASPSPESAMTPAAVASAITRVSDTERTITADAARALGEHTADMLAGTRFEPHSASGRIDGVQIFGVRPDDVATALGLLNGDVLTAVGEITTDTAEHAQQGIGQLATRDEVRFRLVRRGQPSEIVVRRAAH